VRSARSRGRLLPTTGLLAAAGLAAAMMAPLGADASTLRAPVAHVRLPAAAEQLQPYVAQDSCDPTAKPGVVAFRAMMLATYGRGRDGGIVQSCSVPGVSEHKEGRAWDWMLDYANPKDRAVAEAALAWLLRPGPHGEPAWNARRLGIMYIIWDRHIWGAYRQAEGWRPYVGVSAHTDHIHFSFGWNGAWKRTSWWTGRVAPVDYGPCAVVAGMAAPAYYGVNPVPCRDPSMAGPPPTVFAGPHWTGARVLEVQRVLGVPASGAYMASTARAVALWQLHHRLPETGVLDLRTALAMGFVRPVLARGSAYAGPANTGPRVVLLQEILHVSPVSAYYGPSTADAVAGWQSRHRLPVTGVVDLRTARAMGLVR
jgi:Putative peptidoglycan binding domain